jgi:hypothetical protein
VRETEAEAVAFVVSEAIGLEAMRSCAEYISLYTGDKDLLTESLGHIQRASAENHRRDHRAGLIVSSGSPARRASQTSPSVRDLLATVRDPVAPAIETTCSAFQRIRREGRKLED